MHTRLLTQAQVREVLQMEQALAAVEQAFRAHGRGAALMPAKVYLPLEHHHGDFRAMPAYLEGAAGVKWVNSHPRNATLHGLPSVMGLYVLSDPATARPLAVMDATLLTAVRTGAGAGVASKYLAKKGATTLGFVGCGVQARHVLQAHRLVFGDGLACKMSDISREAAERFASEAGGEAVSLEEACAADIVCTMTPSRSPIVQRSWVRPGAHINALGADAPGKEELASEILQAAHVVLDDWEQGTESGEVNVPLHGGQLDKERIWGTIGDAIATQSRVRDSEQDITVFDSTGLAIQDVAVARAIYDTAVDRGIGTDIEFIP
jgi:ornithine cyclodeaminase/alanine dehydrogenase